MSYYPEWLDPPDALLPEYQEHALAWVDMIEPDEIEKDLLEDHHDD